MAEPLARSDAIRLLEDAVGLIRQAPAGVLVSYWMGSVPFALALLVSWSSVTNTRTTDASWAGESMVLALLLLWMNCCRTVYAGKLRRHLSGIPDSAWTARRAFRLTFTTIILPSSASAWFALSSCGFAISRREI